MGTDCQPSSAGLVSALCSESRRCKAARKDLLSVVIAMPHEPDGEDLAVFCEALDRLAHVLDNQCVLVTRALVAIDADRRKAQDELLRTLSEVPQRYRLPP
uniref:Uncharacterized protein n=1 Tax=uncultured marine virus TaxID=186617 RepID=A0A0F7L770_9VIRU|nr:hypothetical protein [uncultured marine virus]